MEVVFTIDGMEVVNSKHKRIKRNKGKSILKFPETFTLLDIETTGLDPQFDDIIEVGAIKVKDGITIDTFETLVLPSKEDFELDDFIVNLTGITNEALNASGISTKSALSELISFIGNDIVLGYNVSFDINFIYDNVLNLFNKEFRNNYIDMMRFSRKAFPNLHHHRVRDMINHFELSSSQKHRALSDCKLELHIFNLIKEKVTNDPGMDEFLALFKKGSQSNSRNLNANTITTNNTTFDKNNPFYKMNVAFTGRLDTLKRKDAMQIIKDLGGEPQNNVTKKSDFLLLGNNFYSSQLKDGKSEKYRKALELKDQGQDLDIITEDVFLDLIGEELNN
ncbi:exonuclease domain-containing protein [Pediococcus acidilactici]|uniref:exonuclease domain-containing protein n=1 Tax=Pediococcus acidilactici TaxID=1254 RepID=UPI002330DF24|nr:exonuclease domain-containing protein [Pediococcus acidilactici]MDB8867646.1 exonuclease domain-containing protein [Pediococcus acidilactici]